MGKIRDIDIKIKILVDNMSDIDNTTIDRLHNRMLQLQNIILTGNQQKFKKLTDTLTDYIDKGTKHIEAIKRDSFDIDASLGRIRKLDRQIDGFIQESHSIQNNLKQHTLPENDKTRMLTIQTTMKQLSLRICQYEAAQIEYIRNTGQMHQEAKDRDMRRSQEKKKMKQQIKVLENRCRTAENEKKEIEEARRVLANQLKDSNDRYVQLQNVLNSVKSQLKTTECSQKLAKSAEQQWKSAENELKLVEQRLREVEANRQQLQNALNLKQATAKSQDQLVKSLESQVKIHELQNRAIQTQLAQIQTALTVSRQSESGLRCQIQAIQQQNTKQAKQLKQLFTRKDTIQQNQIGQLEKQCKTLQASNKQLQLSHKQLQSLRYQYQLLSREYSQLRKMNKTQQLRISNVSEEKRVFSSRKREECPTNSVKMVQSRQFIKKQLPRRILKLREMLEKYRKQLPYGCQIDQTGYLKSREEGTYLYDEEGDLFELTKEEISKAIEHGIINI